MAFEVMARRHNLILLSTDLFAFMSTCTMLLSCNYVRSVTAKLIEEPFEHLTG
jgi:hypothetical protein